MSSTTGPERGPRRWSLAARLTLWYSASSFLLIAARAGGRRFVVQAAFDQSEEETLLADFRRNLFGVLAVSVLACAGLGYMIASRGLRPLAAITAAAGRVRSTTLHERLRTDGLP